MNFFKSKKIVTVFLAVIIVSVISSAVFLKRNREGDIVRADVYDNIKGFAWSELYGWISFNSSDCDSDNDGLIDNSDCGTLNTAIAKYGAKIGTDSRIANNVNGYAWNPLLGYICIGDTCQTAEDLATGWKPSRDSVFLPNDADMKATYTYSGEKLSGWANVLSLKDKGWIRFDDDNIADSISYGVSIDSATGSSTGWAWNGNGDNTGVGWISFNSTDCDSNDNGLVDEPNCGNYGSSTSRYAVVFDVNLPPNLNTVGPNYTGANDPCLDGNKVNNPVFAWTFDDPGDFQSAYQLVVSSVSPVTVVFDSSKVSGSVSSKKITTNLSYNTSYTYSLTVWDSGSPIKSTSTTGSFTTKANEYPDVSFSWYAPNASAEEEIMFTADICRYYTGGTAHNCDASSLLKWKTTDIADIISTSTATSTLITFATKGTSDEVKFTATSTVGNLSCSTSTMMKVSEKLPNWTER